MKSEKLRCWYTNATSLENKWDQFKAELLEKNQPHLVFVTETWFSDVSLKLLDNYVIFNKDREARREWGVSIYVRNGVVACDVSQQVIVGEQVEKI